MLQTRWIDWLKLLKTWPGLTITIKHPAVVLLHHLHHLVKRTSAMLLVVLLLLQRRGLLLLEVLLQMLLSLLLNSTLCKLCLAGYALHRIRVAGECNQPSYVPLLPPETPPLKAVQCCGRDLLQPVKHDTHRSNYRGAVRANTRNHLTQ